MVSLVAAVTLLFALANSGCVLSGRAISGKVLEVGTNKPIQNAIVVADWNGSVSAIVDSQTVCVHVDATTTDAQGKYRLPAWSWKSTVGLVTDVGPIVSVYKLGYEEVFDDRDDENVLHLKVFTGNRRERFEYLERTAGVGICGNESDGNTLAYRRAIASEAQMIAETMEEKRAMYSFIREVENVTLGFREAEARYLERVDAREEKVPAMAIGSAANPLETAAPSITSPPPRK
jgi:hypothetical protein